MGLLTALGLEPTRAAPPKAPAHAEPGRAQAAPAKSPEMQSLVVRFQKVMERIKALEAGKAPEAGELKKATIAAGNLSTGPKGIVGANAALDQVEARIADARAKLGAAPSGGADAAEGAPPDGRKLAGDARRRLKSIEARGRKAIAANPRNPNAGWLRDVVASSESRIVQLEKHGAPQQVESVREQLDWLEESVAGFEAQAARNAPADGAASDGRRLAADARKRLRSLEQRGRKAIAANPRNPNDGWLTQVVAHSEGRFARLEKHGTPRAADEVRQHLDWLEENVVRNEEEATRAAQEGGG
jgi:hypothetical protein